MFGIGLFARIGHVSVRTLRHYQDVGLLEPAAVDEATGYRFYRADQLSRLNRILALKDLGFSLPEIVSVLDDGVSAEALAGMLRLRQAESTELIEREQARLQRVAHRLSLIEGETMAGHATTNTADVIVKPLEAQRVALVTEGTAEMSEDFSPIFARLYPKLFEGLGRLGVEPAGVTIALYDDTEGDAMHIFAGVPVAADADAPADAAAEFGIEFRDLPPVERAATVVHEGSMATVEQSYGALVQWLEANGETAATKSREIYLACDGPQDTWVTELQFPLA